MVSFRELIEGEDIIIAPNSYDVASARIVEEVGYPICYFGGLANAASDLGCPDVGLATSTEFIRRAANIVQVVNVPVVCDADTGFGGVNNLARTVRMFEAAGVSGIHIEDQVFPKRCGVLSGKKSVSMESFCKKVRVAVDSRKSDDFIIIARTDAKNLGIEEVIRRLNAYVDSGADMAMLGELYSLDDYTRIVREVKAPIVGNAADEEHFSIQPNFTVDEWKKTGIKMVIYWHLLLFTAMKAVEKALTTLKNRGTTDSLVNDIFTHTEYERIVKLSQWIDRDEKFGD